MSRQSSALRSTASALIASGVMTKLSTSGLSLVSRQNGTLAAVPTETQHGARTKTAKQVHDREVSGREIIARSEHRGFVAKADEIFGDDTAQLVIADRNRCRRVGSGAGALRGVRSSRRHRQGAGASSGGSSTAPCRTFPGLATSLSDLGI